MATIAMPHLGMGGHLRPAVRLGAVLVRQGHRVIAWGPEGYREHIEATGAEFRPHDPVRARIWSLPALSADLAEATERCAGTLINEFHEERVELVAHDLHVLWARVAGDFLGLPRLVSNPLFPGFDPASSGTADPLPGGLGSAFRLGVARGNAAPSPALMDEIDRAHARVEASRLSIGRRWGVDIGEWASTLSSTAAVSVSFTTQELTGRPAPDEGWHYVGPLMGPAPPRKARDDPDALPLVYVAFGTALNLHPGVFRAAIEALTGEPVRALVSTGGHRIPFDSLPPLPQNVVVHDFVDARQVLAEAALHVTHGGCSSVHESLLAGVPMVCVPHSSDQFHWAERVAALGAGRTVEMDARAIRAGVRELLGDRVAHNRAAQLGHHLAAFDGESRVAQAVKSALQR